MQILHLKQMRGKSFAIWAMDPAPPKVQGPQPQNTRPIVGHAGRVL